MVGGDAASDHYRLFGDQNVFHKAAGAGVLGRTPGNSQEGGVFLAKRVDLNRRIIHDVVHQATWSGQQDGLDLLHASPKLGDDLRESGLNRIWRSRSPV